MSVKASQETMNRSRVVAVGVNDVIDGADIIKDSPSPAVLVGGQGDLTKLADYPAGTMAYTAGFKAMWQKGLDGDWVSVL